MSALPAIADMCSAFVHVRLCKKRTIAEVTRAYERPRQGTARALEWSRPTRARCRRLGLPAAHPALEPIRQRVFQLGRKRVPHKCDNGLRPRRLRRLSSTRRSADLRAQDAVNVSKPLRVLSPTGRFHTSSSRRSRRKNGTVTRRQLHFGGNIDKHVSFCRRERAWGTMDPPFGSSAKYVSTRSRCPLRRELPAR